MKSSIIYQLTYYHCGEVTLKELRDFVDKALGFDYDTLVEVGRDALTIKMNADHQPPVPRDAFPRDELGRFTKRN